MVIWSDHHHPHTWQAGGILSRKLEKPVGDAPKLRDITFTRPVCSIHYIHYTLLNYYTLHYVTLHFTLTHWGCIALQWEYRDITLCDITFRYNPLGLHCIALGIPWHYIPDSPDRDKNPQPTFTFNVGTKTSHHRHHYQCGAIKHF